MTLTGCVTEKDIMDNAAFKAASDHSTCREGEVKTTLLKKLGDKYLVGVHCIHPANIKEYNVYFVCTCIQTSDISCYCRMQ